MAKKKGRNDKLPMSKGMAGVLLVGVAAIFGTILWVVLSSKPKDVSEPEYKPKVVKKVSKSKTVKSSSSSVSSSSDASSEEDDLNAIVAGAQGRIDTYLEHKDKPIDDTTQTTTIANYLNNVVELIKTNTDAKAPHDYDLDDSMGLAMLDTFKTAINAGYSIDADSVKAYESKRSNVIQYTFTMSREGKSNAFFIGNYLPNLGRGTITRMEGTLDNVAFE